jgi:preprotein translocase SecE subunit
VAEKLDDISVSEEEFEPQNEALSVPESTGGETPRKAPSASSLGAGRSGKQQAATPGFFTRTGQYFRDTRAEMRRVSWPTGTEVKNTTIITLVAVVFFALYLFGVDRVWAFLIDHLRVWLGGT